MMKLFFLFAVVLLIGAGIAMYAIFGGFDEVEKIEVPSVEVKVNNRTIELPEVEVKVNLNNSGR